MELRAKIPSKERSARWKEEKKLPFSGPALLKRPQALSSLDPPQDL